jgi:penicillin-binding protein-related factor A (putative recombinase)
MKNDFENKIDLYLKSVKASGKGIGFKNNPSRTHDGLYLAGEPFDYTVFTHKGCFCFDAKMTEKESWPFLRKDIKQGTNLYKIESLNDNNTCFFLIYYTKYRNYYYLPIKTFIKIYDSGRKNIKVQDCLSVKLEELLL